MKAFRYLSIFLTGYIPLSAISQRPATYTNLDPPFWLTWWFKPAVALGIIILIIFRLRVRTSSIQKRKLGQRVNEQARQLLNAVNDKLDFSKIESGNMELETEDFDLRVCIEGIFDILGAKVEATGIDLIYHIDRDVPVQLVGDSLRLRQVLTNLVGNAIKFTAEGEVFIGVHLRRSNPDDSLELEFEIRDTGIGIAPDKVKRLFKAFGQRDSSTTQSSGGTGPGLAISQNLVNLMGGEISVQSDPGIGSTFTFNIYTRRGNKSLPNYTHYDMGEHAGKTILVVDDNTTNRIILRNQLHRWNLNPVIANSGIEAMAVLGTQTKFDLVLTDMQMPGMDGISLARAIRHLHPQIPCILLNSNTKEYSKKNLQLFTSVLTKPIKQHVLNQHILGALQNDGKLDPEEKLVDGILQEKLSHE